MTSTPVRTQFTRRVPGYDRGGLLTDAVNRTPHAVVLLDEIEKAHPDVFNILLQIMDHGTLTDNNGKQSDFRHVILLMTSNIGARDLEKGALGFGDREDLQVDDRAYENKFSPEFRTRLDARIRFSALKPEVMVKIVDKFIWQLDGQLAEKRVLLQLTDAARTLLGQMGYDPKFGARPLDRVIQEAVKGPLSDALLFGERSNGGSATIDAEDDAIVFKFDASARKKRTRKKPRPATVN